MRLAILFDHFGPYHLARIRAAAGTAEILAVEVRGRSREYAWKSPETTESFTRTTLFSADESHSISAGELHERLGRVLDPFAPEVVAIPGWSGSAAFVAMQWCLRRGIPPLLMSESTTHDEVRSVWREAIKRRYVALASSALVGGSAHVTYLESLGLAPDRIFTGYDAVDNTHFISESERWRAEDKAIPPYFLASNRFIPKKNLFRLLEAYARYAELKSKIRNPNSEIHHAWPLCLLGDGELKPALLQHAHDLGLTVVESAPWELETSNLKPETVAESRPVFLPGFRQIDELPRFYAHAGAFVHASTTEQWGLVVNEAMASPLPVLVSNRCGCAPDLVHEGGNGWTFDPLDVDGLAELMGRVAGMAEPDRLALGLASQALIADWGPERFATGLKAAAEKALEVGPKRAGWLDRAMLSLLARR